MTPLRATIPALLFVFVPIASFADSTGAAPTAPTSVKHVAILIDDGPIPAQLPAFLELFAREGVKVSLAHVGREVNAHPAHTRAAAEAGHEIVNHSYTHPHFTQLDDESIVREVRDTQAAVQAAIGRAPAWYWAPYGDWDDRIAAAVAKAGMKPIPVDRMHFVSSEDWNREVDAATILRRATHDIRDGTLLLFHEWRAETLAQMPAVLAALREQGCTFVTVSELTRRVTAVPAVH
ncbi:polysaccharide deacetylase family protein [Congregicoccus parvus]|uniref:polysaccharide deacetylase family protein n=1 Tax=Congregicoccus parvus TaxID=3081749 RepID=UPI003FA54295